MRPVNEREQAFTYIIVFALFLKQSAGALMNVMAIYHQLRTVGRTVWSYSIVSSERSTPRIHRVATTRLVPLTGVVRRKCVYG
jgi:hypothetical protein